MAASAGDPRTLDELVARRLDGVPVARLVGRAHFAGIELLVDDDVYLPRWTSEAVVDHAVSLLPDDGTAVDLCTGTGALAAALLRGRPRATVVATDLSPAAVACARRNGVDAREGDLDAALPQELRGRVDLVVAVPPFVPTGALDRLHRDVRRHEPTMALDGGDDGLGVARRIVDRAPRWLRPGGWLVVQVGADQVPVLAAAAATGRWDRADVVRDGDGDLCALAARLRR